MDESRTSGVLELIPITSCCIHILASSFFLVILRLGWLISLCRQANNTLPVIRELYHCNFITFISYYI